MLIILRLLVNMKRALMSVTIDTECDKSIDWSNSNPLTFRSVTEGIPDILQPLFKKFSIFSDAVCNFSTTEPEPF